MDDVINEEVDDKRKEDKKRPIVIILFIAILGLAVIVGYMLLNREEPVEEEGSNKRAVVLTEDNVEEVLAQMSQEEFIEPGYYQVSMNNVWHFANGKAESDDVYIENATVNTNDVYFDLVLESDESQILYSSPVIPRGAVLEHFALDTPLDAGTYSCVMIYHLIDEDQNTVSTLRVGVTVIIEE